MVQRPNALSLLAVALMLTIKVSEGFTYVPKDGCILADKTNWVIAYEPADPSLYRFPAANAFDNWWQECYHYTPDVNITIDMGEVKSFWEHSWVFEAQWWFRTRVDEWSMYASENGIDWTYQGTMEPIDWNNQRKGITPSTIMPVRYWRHEFKGGRPATKWGFREIIVSDCGPWMTSTTSNTTTTASSSTATSTSTMTATTSTATTSSSTTATTTTITSTATTSSSTSSSTSVTTSVTSLTTTTTVTTSTTTTTTSTATSLTTTTTLTTTTATTTTTSTGTTTMTTVTTTTTATTTTSTATSLTTTTTVTTGTATTTTTTATSLTTSATETVTATTTTSTVTTATATTTKTTATSLTTNATETVTATTTTSTVTLTATTVTATVTSSSWTITDTTATATSPITSTLLSVGEGGTATVTTSAIALSSSTKSTAAANAPSSPSANSSPSSSSTTSTATLPVTSSAAATTTTTSSRIPSVAQVMAAKDDFWLVQRLALSSANRDKEMHMGGMMMAAKVPKAMETTEHVMKLGDGEVKVQIPPSFFQGVNESLYMVVRDFSKDVQIQMGTEATGIVNIEFWIGVRENVRRHHVAELKDPLRFALPVSYQPGLACAYYKVGEGWSTEGVTTVPNGASGAVECLTTHLSIFGALPRKELLFLEEATVTSELGSLLLAGIGALFAYLFAVASCLDCRRADTSVWSRESFLLPKNPQPSVYESPALKTSGVLTVLCQSTVEAFRGSIKALKEQLTFSLRLIMGRHAEGRAFVLARLLLLGDARRAAAATLELGDEAACYVLAETALPEVFAEQVAVFWANSPEEREAAALKAACLGGEQHKASREELWAGLYFMVNQRINSALYGRSLGSMAKVFRAQNPSAYGYTFSMFTPRKMATLIHAAYFITALIMAVGFMEAGDFSDDMDVRMVVLLTIAAGFIARVVPWALKSLHMRELRTVAFEGCSEWRLRLRVWALQDSITYGLGLLFVAAGALALAFHVATSSAEGHLGFGLALLVLALQEFAIFPALWSIVPPVVGMWLLNIASKRSGICKKDLLDRMAPIFAPTARA